MNAYVEQAITFSCQGSTLLGIVAAPAPGQPQSDTAVLVVVGGPQYRAGSHRQFVQLARALAGAGHVALRFDVRGMGDSQGEPAGFEAQSEDIAAAIDALKLQAPQARQLALFGLCDGASAALLYMHDTRDARIGAICLLNPWVRTEESLARTHVRHYYLQRLASGEFWRKLLGGGVGKRALREFVATLRSSQGRTQPLSVTDPAGRNGVHFRMAMRTGFVNFSGPILLALSGEDLTAKEFLDTATTDEIWSKVMARRGTQTVHLPGADHTLSFAAGQRAFEAAMIGWLRASSIAPA